MEEKDREIWIGGNRLYLGEDSILHITVVGGIDKEIANRIKEADLRFKSMVEHRFDILADVNKSGKHSSEARKIWAEMADHYKTGKIAMFGMNPVARVIASFVMGVTRKTDMRFFRTKEDALAWLEN